MLTVFAIALTYYLAGRVALLFGMPFGQPPPVWPAAGIALATTLAFGYRSAVGVFLGSTAMIISISLPAPSLPHTVLLAASIGLGAALQALVGSYLIRRFVPYPADFSQLRQPLLFLLLGGPVCCLINASWSPASLVLGGAVPSANYPSLFIRWWLNNSIGVFTCALPLLVWIDRTRSFSLRRKLFISVPLVIALALVALSYFYIHAWEQDRLRQAFGRRTDSLSQQLKSNLDGYVDVLNGLGDFFRQSTSVSRQQFSALAARWLARHPGIRTLSWQPLIKDAERASYEAAARRDGLTGFAITELTAQGHIVRADARPEYVPVYYRETLRSDGRALGFDLASEPIRRQALELARDTGRPSASEETVLLNDNNEQGFLIYLPIFKPGSFATIDERRRHLVGYLAGVFQINEVLSALTSNQENRDIQIRLYQAKDYAKDTALPARTSPVGLAQRDPLALRRVIPFNYAERKWVLEFTPTRNYLTAATTSQPWSVLLAGLVISGLLGAFLMAVTGYTNKVEAMNAELERETQARGRANEELQKFASMVNSSDDAIIHTLLDGEIVTWNRGAERLYEYAEAEAIGRSITMLHPPEARQEYAKAHARLARGESVGPYETIRLKKHGTPVWISVRLSPLKNPCGEITGVVSVSRDITERRQAEARLQQDRTEVAQRLHDSLAQSLTAFGLHLTSAHRVLANEPEAAQRQLDKMTQLLAEEQVQLRLLLRELREGGLAIQAAETADMAATLAELTQRLQAQWNVRIDLQIAAERVDPVAPQIMDNLIYLVQEGVANAARHGHASLLHIIVASTQTQLALSISDNGCGFPFSGRYDLPRLNELNLGPWTVKERVAKLRGTLTIDTSENGAILQITLPLV